MQSGHNTTGGEQVSGGTLRVLVVDDNRDSAEMLALLVSMQGHDTDRAFDGMSAIDVAERFRPDVVLLDVGLPGMNGYEVARELRRRPHLGEPRIVAITGWGQVEDRERALAAGCDHHITKPADPVAIEQLLAEYARGRALRGSADPRIR